MTIKQAINKIVKEWEALKENQDTGSYSSPKMIAVWCGKSDTAGSCEIDEEWIGVTPQGEIAWAYASGCSCWEGDFDEKRFESMKEVTLVHTQNTPKKWEEIVIAFAETGNIQEL